MINIVFNTGSNSQATYKVFSAQEAISVLNMKNNSYYFEFLLRTQVTPPVTVKQQTSNYIFSMLGLPAVKCKSLGQLNRHLIGYAEKLFKLADDSKAVNKFLKYTFSLLHNVFTQSIIRPLLAVSPLDLFEELPEYFTQKSINGNICYFDERLSNEDLKILYIISNSNQQH